MMKRRNIVSVAVSVALFLCAFCAFTLRKGASVARQQEDESDKSTKANQPFALVRPATPHDANVLLSSFELWQENLFPPCNDRNRDGSSEAVVDLILSFSRMEEETYRIAELIHRDFKRSNGWGNCIRNFLVLDSDLSEEEDKYSSKTQDSDYNWVNGPNSQFRSVFYDIHDLGYETFFYMEADTFPRAPGWLDTLRNEIEESRPFGIIGSKYKGNVWDSFKDQMPLSLVEHMNGNAVYNATDPLLIRMVDELQNEKDTLYNAVSYDYRLSQIYFEGAKEEPAAFPFPKLLEASSSMGLPPKMELFQHWWEELGYDTFITHSKTIHNFGVVRDQLEDLGDCVLVHGRQYNPFLNPSTTSTDALAQQVQQYLRRNENLLGPGVSHRKIKA